MESSRQEDYFVLATLTAGNDEVTNVPCKIFLPQDVRQNIQVSLRPNKEQYDLLSHFHQASLYAELNNHTSTLSGSIVCDVMHSKGGNTLYWGPELSESSIEYQPQDMRVTAFHGPSNDLKRTHVVFWISPNKMLSPMMIQESSYLGSIKMKRVRQLEFSLNSSITIKFDKHFQSKRDGELFIQWPILVAETDIDIAGTDIEGFRHQYLESLDDFFLLASVGSRTHTACIGWTATDRESYTRS
jgi:hypothetical protein